MSPIVPPTRARTPFWPPHSTCFPLPGYRFWIGVPPGIWLPATAALAGTATITCGTAIDRVYHTKYSAVAHTPPPVFRVTPGSAMRVCVGLGSAGAAGGLMKLGTAGFVGGRDGRVSGVSAVAA